MKNLKVFALVLVVALASLGMVFASGQQEGAADSGEEKMIFALSVPQMANPYFVQVVQGFKDKCDELGIESVINDAKYDATAQYNHFENYIAMGAAAASACPVDFRSLEAVVDEAHEAGMIVVGEAQAIPNADANIIVDDYGYGVVIGECAAKWINEKLGGEAKVLLLTLDNVEAVVLRGNGMTDVLNEKCPNAEIVARQTATCPEEGLQVTETILQAHPDVNVIACINDSAALGAYEAVKNMGIDDPLFYIGGADNTDEMLSKMKEPGSVLRCTVDIDPYGTGKKCVEVMYDYVKNGAKNETFYFDMIPVWQDEL